MPLNDQLPASEHQDVLLHEAITGLENALVTPVVDAPRWRLRIAMAADHALDLLEEHVVQSEACGGVLDRVGETSPRLARRANQLCVDHERLRSAATALRRAIGDVEETAIVRQAPELRKAAIELIGQLDSHRQQRLALLDSYQVHVDEAGPQAVAL